MFLSYHWLRRKHCREKPKGIPYTWKLLVRGFTTPFLFDRLYRVDKKIKTSFTAGVTLIPTPELFVVAAPVSYNFLFGTKSHHLELGLGITAMYLRQGQIQSTSNFIDDNGLHQSEKFTGHANNFYTYFTPKVGYRYQRSSGGLFLRVTFTPEVAGMSREGATKGGTHENFSWSSTSYFQEAAFFGSRIMPWAGISVGWTLKK